MRTRVFILALLLGSSERAAQAQSLRLPPVRYEAPDSCPSRDFFLERLRARLRAARVRALTSLKLAVELDAGPTAVRGTIQIERGTSRARRTLDGPTCREVVEGLALIAALAVTSAVAGPVQRSMSSGSTGTANPASPRARERSTHEPASPPRPERLPRAAPSASPSPGVVPAMDPDVRPNDASPPPSAARAARSAASPLGADDRSNGAIGGAHPPTTWSVGLSMLALHGLAPSLRPGLQLQAALIVPGSLDWTLRIGGRVSLPQSLRSEDGTANFAFAAGVVQLCGGGGASSAFAVEGCAVAEPGLLHASGEDTDNSETYDRPWLAVGGGAGLGWRAARWLLLRAGAEVLVPTRRDRMLLAGQMLHRIPLLLLRLQLALEVPIE